MNCRPGDIARIVNNAGYEGRLVEVLRAAVTTDCTVIDALAWWCRSLGAPLPTYCDDGRTVHLQERAIRDRDLRPIRDPGDDAIDEISTRKPVERDATLIPKPQREHCL